MAKMKSSKKKGIYFTLITLLIISVMIISFASRSYVSLKDDAKVVKSRVQVADNYVKNIGEVYVERALYVSSYWALEALSEYENKTGLFLPSRADFNNKFAELMINGSIDGEQIDLITGRKIMNNNTFYHRLGQIENSSLAAYSIRTNFSRNYQDFNVKIWQSNETGPWKVAVNITASYLVDSGLARWNQTITRQAIFDIKGITDPLYSVKTSGSYSRKIQEANYGYWNYTNLYEHIDNETYKAEPNGTSFLDRFYNNLTRSGCCGIESLINPNAMGISDTNISYADWCFYTTNICPPNSQGLFWKITGLTSSSPPQKFYAFKLDDYHVVVYNVTSEAYN